MNQKIKSVLLLCASLVLVAAGCQKTSSKAETPVSNTEEKKIEETKKDSLKVVATLFPYYDFAKAIVGDLAEVSMVLPAGQDSHSFEPTSSDMIRIQNADVFLYNGGEMETWVTQVLDAAPNENRKEYCGFDSVSLYEEELSASMEEEKGEEETAESYAIEYDEHIWTSPVNAQKLVEGILAVLVEADPEQEAIYTKNAETYLKELQAVDEGFREIVSEARQKTLVFGDRFPFLYFVKEYGLSYDAAFPGCSSDTEPSPATIAKLIEFVKENQIQVIYHVELSSAKTAELIAESTGAEVLELNSCHNVTKEQLENGVTYVDLMKQNMENLKKGLQ